MKILLLIALALALQAPALAQRDGVTVRVLNSETCPSGWTTVDTPFTKAARIFYVLPAALVDAYRRTHIGRYDTVEFEVTQTFVTSIWPTPTQQQAAYSSGRLRAEPATSGTVRKCTIGP